MRVPPILRTVAAFSVAPILQPLGCEPEPVEVRVVQEFAVSPTTTHREGILRGMDASLVASWLFSGADELQRLRISPEELRSARLVRVNLSLAEGQPVELAGELGEAQLFISAGKMRTLLASVKRPSRSLPVRLVPTTGDLRLFFTTPDARVDAEVTISDLAPQNEPIRMQLELVFELDARVIPIQ
jgi:hypothetical protein